MQLNQIKPTHQTGHSPGLAVFLMNILKGEVARHTSSVMLMPSLNANTAMGTNVLQETISSTSFTQTASPTGYLGEHDDFFQIHKTLDQQIPKKLGHSKKFSV